MQSTTARAVKMLQPVSQRFHRQVATSVRTLQITVNSLAKPEAVIGQNLTPQLAVGESRATGD
jgi:hypothetical protein